ncbi:hypothetical protein B0J12DRAFT_693176 [Macrophomina phaseolina]|uniref:Uncharacterized protein n=1 Tax=Macrophomina phaseolina TaxID=35725 RepID=A0ABQ8GX38_9PEZI|nr:hypothetical protein B0J12DRAFT_693176 [Macrophomina phaseolina]
MTNRGRAGGYSSMHWGRRSARLKAEGGWQWGICKQKQSKTQWQRQQARAELQTRELHDSSVRPQLILAPSSCVCRTTQAAPQEPPPPCCVARGLSDSRAGSSAEARAGPCADGSLGSLPPEYACQQRTRSKVHAPQPAAHSSLTLVPSTDGQNSTDGHHTHRCARASSSTSLCPIFCSGRRRHALSDAPEAQRPPRSQAGDALLFTPSHCIPRAPHVTTLESPPKSHFAPAEDTFPA